MILTKATPIYIILPFQPTPREEFAAREIARYLNRIFGIKAFWSKERSPGANCFYLGGPARNPGAAFLLSEEDFGALLTGPEGMLVEIRDREVLIAGSEGFDDCERGIVYGVYEFLEWFLGCCLAAYSKPGTCAGEIVPVYDSLTLPDCRYVKAGADRPYRTAIVQYGEAAGNPCHELNLSFVDWLAKNRYNRILTWASVYEAYKETGLTQELEKRGIRLSVGHHESSRMWLPYYGNKYFPEHYRKTHPEYYRLNPDGTRYQPKDASDHTGQWIYCSRNTDCIRQVAENLISWTEENPLVDTIAFWPNDGISPQCCCEECSKYSKVENYAYFQNEVAKRVSAARPRIKMNMLVYVDLWKCPEGFRAEQNLQIDEAARGRTQRNNIRLLRMAFRYSEIETADGANRERDGFPFSGVR